MKFIYCNSVIYSVPNEEERQIAETLTRRYVPMEGRMRPQVDFDYSMLDDEEVDEHYLFGSEVANKIYDSWLGAWDW